MLNKLKQSNRKDPNAKGFTIIEVMIVLAIAGLILLIVFLAVPALQRSARNNQRKADVGRIGSAVTTVVSNNNGAVDTTVLTGGASGTVATETGSKLSYYTPANISVVTGAAVIASNTATKDTVIVVANAKCTSVGGGTTPATRQIALLYATESGGTDTPVCVDQ